MRGTKAKQLRKAAELYIKQLRVPGTLTVRGVYKQMKKRFKEIKKNGLT